MADNPSCPACRKYNAILTDTCRDCGHVVGKNVHTFETTGEAYDACQCDDGIRDGDVLVITTEKVVGVADTWPFAVTKEHGSLHRLSDGTLPEDLEKPALRIGASAAAKVAAGLGYEVAW